MLSRSSTLTRPSSMSAMSSRVEFVPMSTTPTRIYAAACGIGSPASAAGGVSTARAAVRGGGVVGGEAAQGGAGRGGRGADVRHDEQVRRAEERVVGGKGLGVGDVER